MSLLRLNCKRQFLNTWKGTFIESNDILSFLKPVVHRPSTPWCVFLYSTGALFVLINTSSVKLPSLDLHRGVSIKDSVIVFLALIWLFLWRPNYRWREGFRVWNLVFLVLFRMTNDRAEISSVIFDQLCSPCHRGWGLQAENSIACCWSNQNRSFRILEVPSSENFLVYVSTFHLFNIHWVPIRAQLKSCSKSPPEPHTLWCDVGPAYH